MTNRLFALRVLAWLTGLYALTGVICCGLWWVPHAQMGSYLRPQWDQIAWLTRAALFATEYYLWLPAGVGVSMLAVLAFSLEAAGSRASRLLLFYGVAITVLSALVLVCAVYLSHIGSVRVNAYTAVFYSETEILDWAPAAFTLLLPLMARLGLALMHPRRAGVQGGPTCQFCGYNLTGNVSGVCPECGERI